MPAAPEFASIAERKSRHYPLALTCRNTSKAKRAALFVAGAGETRLLGVTRQLVGEAWLHAGPFQYCGSIGPLELDARQHREMERLGDVLATGCGLRGLFGVDGVWRDGTFWPVEVNPRYTASVEVLERATGLKALAWHRRAFDPAVPAVPEPTGAPAVVVGKAILFARETVTFPTNWSWNLSPVNEMTRYADLPDAGQRIEARRPIMTFFTLGADMAACMEALRGMATEIERQFV